MTITKLRRLLIIEIALLVGGSLGRPALAADTAFFHARNCTSAQREIVQRAANEAKRLLQKNGSDAQFVRWFGPKDNSKASLDVQGAVAYVRQYAIEGLSILGGVALYTQWVTIDCAGTRNGIVAHVTGPGTGVIFLDSPFWSVPDRPSIQHVSKAGVIIHELTHLAGTGDYASAFGYQDAFRFALDLALYYPVGSPFNADNHEYFYNGQ